MTLRALVQAFLTLVLLFALVFACALVVVGK